MRAAAGSEGGAQRGIHSRGESLASQQCWSHAAATCHHQSRSEEDVRSDEDDDDGEDDDDEAASQLS